MSEGRERERERERKIKERGREERREEREGERRRETDRIGEELFCFQIVPQQYLASPKRNIPNAQRERERMG